MFRSEGEKRERERERERDRGRGQGAAHLSLSRCCSLGGVTSVNKAAPGVWIWKTGSWIQNPRAKIFHPGRMDADEMDSTPGVLCAEASKNVVEKSTIGINLHRVPDSPHMPDVGSDISMQDTTQEIS